MKFEEILPSIRKGRRCKRTAWRFIEDDYAHIVSIKDTLADDWELEPIKKEITREMLANALDILIGKQPIDSPSYHDYKKKVFERFCKELGL